MKKGILFLSLLGSLAACAPRDVPADSASLKLSKGETVSTTAAGQRLATCPESSDDWTDISVYEKYEQVVAGSYNTLVVTGYMNCLRVGSVVDIKQGSNRTGPSIGRAKVIALEVKQLEQVRTSDIRGKVAQADYTPTMEGVKKRIQSKHQNLVTLIHIEYVKGSAPDEKLLLEKAVAAADPFSSIDPADKAKLLAGQILEITEIGKKSPFCDNARAPWKDLRIITEEVSAFQSGAMQSLFMTNPLLCANVGDQLAAVTGKNNDPIGQLQLLKIYIGKLDKFTPDLFSDEYTKQNLAVTIQRLGGIIAKRPENQGVVAVAIIRNLAVASSSNGGTTVTPQPGSSTNPPVVTSPTPPAPTPAPAPVDPFASIDPAMTQKLMNGEKVEITTPGQKSPFCDPTKAPWTDVRFQEEDVAAFLSGEMQSVAQTSPAFCAAIGDTVKAVNRKTKAEVGSLQLQGIILVKLSALTADMVPDAYTKARITQLQTQLAPLVKPQFQGVISIGIVKKVDAAPAVQ